jgi:hypothetical protein
VVAREILEVLYAPHKVFKKIVQNPGYMGIFLLLIVFFLAQVASLYVFSTQSYVETTTPQTLPLAAQGDIWTETASYWNANEGVTISNNTDDYVNGTLATTSIEFTASDTNNVWMDINFNGSVKCGNDAFQNVTFRVNQLTPSIAPENASLYLYSLSDSNFYYDLTSLFANNAVNEWNNITLTVGAGAEGWVSSSSFATWENITGFKLDFTWSNSANVDLLVDQLFFKGNYGLYYDLAGGVSYLISTALRSFAPFLFEWLILTGVMYLLIKGLKGNVIWKPLMVSVGFALVVIVIQQVAIVLFYTAALPAVYYPLDYWAGIQGEFQMANQAVSQELSFIQTVTSGLVLAIWIWTIALGTFIVRAVTSDQKMAQQANMGAAATETTVISKVEGLGWMKCLFVSGVSSFLTIVIIGILNLLGI